MEPLASISTWASISEPASTFVIMPHISNPLRALQKGTKHFSTVWSDQEMIGESESNIIARLNVNCLIHIILPLYNLGDLRPYLEGHWKLKG